jgi:phosphate transport system permease protein
MNPRSLKQFIGVNIMRFCSVVTVSFLALFLYKILSKGLGVINWTFLSQPPLKGMTAGGIYPALAGTFWLTVLSILIALPLGLSTAIFLKCYGKPKWLMQIVRISINTLAGIPSIVYGLFGLAVFVNLLKFNVSLISGALTLAVLALPVIINASEEALRSVPGDFYDASLALGATESQTVMRVLIPTALPNILTGVIISIGRVAGETAPIMFTAATFYSLRLPQGISDEVMALPYHIYALMTEGTHAESQVPIAYGSAVVLLLMVLSISSLAIIIRYRIRKKRKW